jgi:hypothetical protein
VTHVHLNKVVSCVHHAPDPKIVEVVLDESYAIARVFIERPIDTLSFTRGCCLTKFTLMAMEES